MRRVTRSSFAAGVVALLGLLLLAPAPAGAVPATDLGISVPPGSGEDMPAPLGTGVSIYYDLELRNFGAANTGQLTITLPTGLVLGPDGVKLYASESGFLDGSATGTALVCAPSSVAGQVTCDAGALAAAPTVDPPIIEIELTATSDGTPGTNGDFSVSVAPGTGTDSNPTNDVVHGSVTFTGVADLDFAISPGFSSVPVGTSLTLTVTVTNHGPQPADETIAIAVLANQGDHFRITGFDGNPGPPGGSPFARLSARKSALTNLSRAARSSGRSVGISPAAVAQTNSAGTFWYIGTIASGHSATAHVTVTGKSVGSEQIGLQAASDAADTGCLPGDTCVPALATLTATPAITTAYIASSRQRAAVYINGLVKQTALTGIIRSGARTVYLQRYINGGWQNMLSRPTGATGQVAVGFIQPKVFAYRLVVIASPGARAAATGVTFR